MSNSTGQAPKVPKMYRTLCALTFLLSACDGSNPNLFTFDPAAGPPPDPCAPPQLVMPVERETLAVGPPYTLVGYATEAVAEGVAFKFGTETPLAVIISGNGYNALNYRALAEFLARDGTIVGVVDRSSGSFVTSDVLGAVELMMAAYGLSDEAPIALVGHSVGGGWALRGALENAGTSAPYDIRAVVGLAPSTAGLEPVPVLPTNFDATLTLIYGGHDEDVDGITDTTADESFAIYDRSGTEESTACAGPACGDLASTGLERFLAFVHGAGHPGLVAESFCPGIQGNCLPASAYLAVEDQFCVARGLTNATIQYRLHNDSRYRRVLTGAHVPASFRAISSVSEDFIGRPAGSPLTIVSQYSPRERKAIQNFESFTGSQLFGNTPDVQFAVVDATSFAGPGVYLRNATKLALISWPERPEPQWIGFDVPPDGRDVSSFTHVAVRAGHVRNVLEHQPPTAVQDLMLCLGDGDRTACLTAEDSLEPVDLRPSQTPGEELAGIPAMQTIAFGLSSFTVIGGVDPERIRTVFVVFPPGTRGTISLDSIEWFRE